jgi:hypothetical protein
MEVFNLIDGWVAFQFGDGRVGPKSGAIVALALSTSMIIYPAALQHREFAGSKGP